MKDALYRAIGRASVWLDPLRGVSDAGERPPGLDGTGLLVRAAERLPVLWDDGEVFFVEYASLAHSFWRAQELSLFRVHSSLLQAPLLDFGMGDGSFASALLRAVDYGVDSDPEALCRAAGYGIYGRLVLATDSEIALSTASVRTVFSNSVLEHIEHLPAVLSELRRLLDKDGVLLFTVPTSSYSTHLTKYFGRTAAERVNRESSHRHLLAPRQWVDLLGRHGLHVRSVLEYQPDWYTFWYRMCRLAGPRGLGRIIPGVRGWVWRRFGHVLVEMVRESIRRTHDGANIFVVAAKTPG